MKFFFVVVVIFCIGAVLRSFLRYLRHKQRAHLAQQLNAYRQVSEYVDRAGREKWMMVICFLIGLWCTIKLFN